MFGRGYRLFSLFGFEVRLDLSWVLIALLVVFSLAQGFFPFIVPGLTPAAYLLMGLGGAVGIFVSIVFHELWHSLVARRYGLPIRGITLFIFGGVAEMTDEPPNPRAEYLMALAGPVASVALGVMFYVLHALIAVSEGPQPIAAVFYYLAMLNVLLAVFNMVPAFPLDGGRVLRALLWKWKKDIRWATRVSSQIGAGFGLALMVLGVLSFLRGNFFGGLWWVLIGLFLREAAGGSYRQLLMREALQGESVRRLMTTEVVTVEPGISVKELVEEYFYKYQFKLYPVVRAGNLLGCVSTDQVRTIPREQWPMRRADEIMELSSSDNTISPDAPALEALSRMQTRGRLMVVQSGRLVGIISMRDLMRFISLKLDLEGHPA